LAGLNGDGMQLRPEDVKIWKIEATRSVSEIALKAHRRPDGKLIKGLYSKLQEKLKTYPPDQQYFSYPRLDLNDALIYWVRSENNKLALRAKYIVWADTCVIDKFHLTDEDPARS
jgi:hypothetical protein